MNARLRRILIATGIVIASLIVLLILGYTQLISYLQGSDFRSLLAENARKSLRADSVELNSNLTINGSRVSINGAALSGMGSIQQASTGRINAEIERSALFSRELHLRKVSIEEASLSLSSGPVQAAAAGDANRPATTTGKGRKRKKTTGRKAETADSASGFSLKGFRLDQLECKDTDLNLTLNGEPYQLLGASVTAAPAPRIGTDAWQFYAENARLHTPFRFLRESSIKAATLVYNNNAVDLTECRIMLTPGELRAKGHYTIKDRRYSMDMQVNKGNLHRLLNDDWKKRASGDLYGRLTLVGSGDGIVAGNGAFSVQNGVLEGLPFLSLLPVGNTYPYRSIELEKADCQIHFPYESDQIGPAWLIDNINIRSRDGALLVRGRVLIGTDRSLGGTLTIGLPRSTVLALPLPQSDITDKLFTANKDESDYLWLNMNLSGTIDQPQEDLSIRISTLVGNNLSGFLKDIPKASAADLLNLLLNQKPDQPAEDTPKATNPIQDAAKAASSLLQSLF